MIKRLFGRPAAPPAAPAAADPADDAAFVDWCFQALLGRQPDEAARRHYADSLGRGAARLDLVRALAASDEFALRVNPDLGSGQADEQFIDWAFQRVLGRPASPEDRLGFMHTLAHGGSRLDMLRGLLDSPEYHSRMGLHSSYRFVPPGHFYSPIPSDEDIARHRSFDWAPAGIPGVDLRDEAQLALLEEFATLYPSIPFGPEPRPGLRYKYQNPSYSYADGILLHCMIRHVRPRRIIEIGSGNSSCVTLDTNELFFGGAIETTFIEPYPELLRSLLKPEDAVTILPVRLQDVPLEQFDILQAGDILFVDSTHVSRLGSDVNRICFEILPRLASGVVIHFHDIIYPFEYPTEWIERGWAWNEQYILRAFLQYNRSFQIKLFSTYMLRTQRAWFERHMPDCLKDTGGHIWIEKL